MSPEIPVILAALLAGITVLRFRSTLSQQGYELTHLIRDIQDPPYPITPEELLKESQARLSNPLASMIFSVSTLFMEFKAVWSKYPDSPQLAKVAKDIRSLIYKYILKLVVIFLLGVLGLIVSRLL